MYYSALAENTTIDTPVLNKKYNWNITNADLPCAVARFRLPWLASAILLYVCNEHNRHTYRTSRNEYKGIPLSYKEITIKMQCSRSMAQNAITTLKEKHLLFVTKGNGTRCNYYVPNVELIKEKLSLCVPH